MLVQRAKSGELHAGRNATWGMSGKPRMLVAMALANKLARTVWALTTKKEEYRIPPLAA
jgi:hypothetical protein